MEVREAVMKKANGSNPANLQGKKVSIPFSVSSLPCPDSLTCFGKDTDVPANPDVLTLKWPELREEELKSAFFDACPYSALSSHCPLYTSPCATLLSSL